MSDKDSRPSFDPYLEWLGIPANRRPITWYDLLKLPRYHADPDRLEEAYFNRYAQIRKYEGGTFGGVALQLLDEIGTAYRGLSHPDEKLCYDDELRRADLAPVTAEVVHDTWAEIDDLLKSYLASRDSNLLRQAEQLAVKIDGPRGNERLAQAALAVGVESHHYEALLTSFADRNNLAVCGNCFSMVAPRERARTMFVSVNEQKDISCDALTTESHSDWLRNWVTIRRENVRETLGVLDNPIEEFCFHLPGLLSVATLAALIPSLVGMLIGFQRKIPVGEMLATLLGAYVCTFVLIAFLYRPRFKSGIDAVWLTLVPAIVSHTFSVFTSSFLAGLARASTKAGTRRLRQQPVRKAIEALTRSTAIQATPEEHLAEMFRLAFQDSLGSRTDFTSFLHYFRALVDSCLKSWLSMDMLDMALRDGEFFKSLRIVEHIGLRLTFIRLCRSYSFTLSDLMRCRHQSHALQWLFPGDINNFAKYVIGLSAVLSSQRGALTDGWTAFELVDDLDLEPLSAAENVLFISRSDQLSIVPGGIRFQDALFTEPLKVAAQRKRALYQGRNEKNPELEIVVNGRVFPGGKHPLGTVERLRRISEWYFDKVAPILAKDSIDLALSQPNSPPVSNWLDRNAVVCRQCSRRVVFVRGQIGTTFATASSIQRR